MSPYSKLCLVSPSQRRGELQAEHEHHGRVLGQILQFRRIGDPADLVAREAGGDSDVLLAITYAVDGKQYIAIATGLTRNQIGRIANSPELKNLAKNATMLFVFGL